MLDQMLEETTIDVFGFWEDMGYKSGPLISPAMVKKFMAPRYRRVVDFVRQNDLQVKAILITHGHLDHVADLVDQQADGAFFGAHDHVVDAGRADHGIREDGRRVCDRQSFGAQRIVRVRVFELYDGADVASYMAFWQGLVDRLGISAEG